MRKHPIVELTRYIALILMASLSLNPVTLTLLWVGSLIIKGRKQIFYNLIMIFIGATVNALTNHKGDTFLFYLNDNIVTFESLIYGIVLGVQVCTLINWIMIMSQNITSDKVVIITSFIFPPLALLISMGIRSVNRYRLKLKEIFCYQKASMRDNSLLQKMLVCINTINIMVSWALENGIETSDSMISRGYGTHRRSSYHLMSINRFDILETVLIILVVVFWCITKPYTSISPFIEINFNIFHTVLTVAYLVYEIMEEWHESRYKLKNS